MSRLYDPRCLRRTKAEVHTERLEGGRWEPGAWQRGDGVIVEGHFIWDASGRKERYFVLYVKPRTIHRRRFDPKGNEVEPNFSETRKVSTGFLPASYRVEAKGPTDRLSLEELECLAAVPELEKMTRPYAPSQTVAFWLPESEMLELEAGTTVRLRTLGDGPFSHWPSWKQGL
ncbi:arpin isoform X1 [Sceloporus undulatus]|uniref:arpin isoform X1 n=1 Tax=Sceloporus undulatus TaxID=8520 RepID=UPI001C4B41E0|nr:arpin isoform X1 [Sceloporus undulatus]